MLPAEHSSSSQPQIIAAAHHNSTTAGRAEKSRDDPFSVSAI
jgi:hypothetical protein